MQFQTAASCFLIHLYPVRNVSRDSLAQKKPCRLCRLLILAGKQLLIHTAFYLIFVHKYN